ncbi:hypothetical protein F511_31341 [Dorcoceras hygrometricum]|uniref:Uncharacterized protein n=1 Tax=Dorcoceras hygrometricum TaxID=472368 RepID=A0A2Z7BCW1_9LAMI|nr:hypothetical protein F511_31341 [Dorcoceras hygrometricum]
MFAQLLSFLRHNTTRNSWFTFIAIAGKKCLRLVVQTLVLKTGDMMCLRLVVQLVVTIPFESLCLQLLSADIADVIVPLALQLVLIVPAGPTYLSSWFIFFLAIITAAGQIWPPPDYEQLTQLWTSPLIIQLPSK